MIVNQVSLDSNVLDIGALLGTSGRSELIQEINSHCGGGSFFGSEMDPYRDSYNVFMQTIVEPIRQARTGLQQVSSSLNKVDQYRSITNLEELERGIPPCMRMGILTYAPIRKQLEEERIDGFGIKAEDLPDEDVYGRLISNGQVEIHSSTLDKDGKIDVKWEFSTDDPEITRDELDMLEDTRTFIDKFMSDEDTKYLDFTDYPNLHS